MATLAIGSHVRIMPPFGSEDDENPTLAMIVSVQYVTPDGSFTDEETDEFQYNVHPVGDDDPESISAYSKEWVELHETV